MAQQMSFIRRTATLTLGVAIATFAGCNTMPQGVASDAEMRGLADSGTLVRLVPEQELVVKLNANRVSGFDWKIDQSIDRTVLLADGSKLTQSSQQKSRQDEVATQYLRFIAQQPGRTTLNLVYTSAREGMMPDTPKYTLEVIVAPKPEAAQ